jgi:phage-related protein
VITLDGHTLDYFGLIPLKGHDNPTPATRDKSLVIPGKHGAWDFGADMDIIQFNFPMAFNEEDRIAVQSRIRAFTAFLFDAYGRPRTFKLIFDYEPDKFYMVRYSGQMKPERLFGLGTFDLPLTAFDPIAKYVVPSDEIIMDSDIPIMSDILWDTGFSNRLITTPQTFEIINNGTLVIIFTCKIEGSGTNLALSANGKTMTLGTFANKVYEIKDNYIVKVDGITDLTSTNGVFLELMPGVNTISVTGSSLNLTISESLTYKYV